MENSYDYCLYCSSVECPFMKDISSPLPCEIGECAYLLKATNHIANLQFD